MEKKAGGFWREGEAEKKTGVKPNSPQLWGDLIGFYHLDGLLPYLLLPELVGSLFLLVF